jgi:hypothetical protein
MRSFFGIIAPVSPDDPQQRLDGGADAGEQASVTYPRFCSELSV